MMGSLSFANPGLIHLLWGVGAIVTGLVVLELRSDGRLGRFLSPTMQQRLVTQQLRGRRLFRLGLIGLCLTLSVFALMRPQSPGTRETLSVRRAAADVMVVLDVSRSMLAEDVAPNRLGRAKADILDLIGHLQETRVGLVAFAGRASVVSPLTSDHSFVRMILRGIDTSSAARGGTRIGDGIRAAIDAFPPGDRARLIVLVTDGEDHDSFPLDAADAAAEAGIRVDSIGFGSEAGSEITLTDPETGAQSALLDGAGNVVISRLDGETLRDVALRTEGAYIPAGVAALDLGSIAEAHVRPMTQVAHTETELRVVRGEQYPWFILASILALLGAVWIESTGARRVEV